VGTVNEIALQPVKARRE